VVFGVRDVYKNLRKNPNVKKFDIIIALNESQEICLVEGVKIHPEYPQFSDSSDFAVLFVRDKVKYFLECASKDELYDLQQGDEIFYLGFPMEGLKNGNLNMNSPTATMQDGRISSISDTTFGSGNAENNILIRHNLPTVGGASGSPIFSASGKVIAILKGGNMDLKFDENGRYLGREPSAAQINFAIRIDRLGACHQINFMHVMDFLEQ
jgi:S1-C subfamily serine protease